MDRQSNQKGENVIWGRSNRRVILEDFIRFIMTDKDANDLKLEIFLQEKLEEYLRTLSQK